MNKDGMEFIDDLILSSNVQHVLQNNNSINIYWNNMGYNQDENCLYISYIKIWLVLEVKYRLEYREINDLMNDRINQYYEIGGFETRHT